MEDERLAALQAEVGELTERLAEARAALEARERDTEVLAFQAMHDVLTDLPNRSLLLDRLAHAIARMGRVAGAVAVLFIDLDRFKVLNDSLGHGAGDRVLVTMSRRIEAVLRPSDTVARFGGDEFVIVCEEITDAVHARAVARRIELAIAQPIELDGRPVVLTCSIGIAIADGPEVRPEDLLRDADVALYRAKDAGRARAELFDRSMRDAAVARLQLEGDLRRALGRDELCVHYQPVFDLETMGVVGVEAFVRWVHPHRGLLLPDRFISVAEEAGLIDDVEREVRRIAFAEAAAWAGQGIELSLNVSARHLSIPGFADGLADDMVAAGWPPERLCLELTERLLLRDNAEVRDTISTLHVMGVRFTIDDFGTGYSALSYLHRYPVDRVKIDRAFVSRVDTGARESALVSAIVAMADALGFSCGAEGVMSETQLEAVRRLGCDTAQGFLLGRPLPASELSFA